MMVGLRPMRVAIKPLGMANRMSMAAKAVSICVPEPTAMPSTLRTYRVKKASTAFQAMNQQKIASRMYLPFGLSPRLTSRRLSQTPGAAAAAVVVSGSAGSRTKASTTPIAISSSSPPTMKGRGTPILNSAPPPKRAMAPPTPPIKLMTPLALLRCSVGYKSPR